MRLGYVYGYVYDWIWYYVDVGVMCYYVSHILSMVNASYSAYLVWCRLRIIVLWFIDVVKFCMKVYIRGKVNIILLDI